MTRRALPLTVAGYAADQLALFVPDVAQAVAAYERAGYVSWVRDLVWAQDNRGAHFVAELAFNYEVFPCEFELIGLRAGRTAQLSPEIVGPGLSHVGFHVDQVEEAIQAFQAAGHGVMAVVQTLHHTGTPRRYKYAFVDTRPLGFVSKLIAVQAS